MTNFVQLFKNMLSDSSERVALIDSSTDREVSYAELTTRVNEIHQLLLLQKVGEGEDVSIVSNNHIDQVASIIAVLQYGAKINGVDLSSERIQSEIQRIECVQGNLSRQVIVMVSASSSKTEILIAALLCGAQVVMMPENISDDAFFQKVKKIRPHIISMNCTFAEEIIRNSIYPSINNAKMSHVMSLSHTRRMVYKQVRKHLMSCLGGCVQNVTVYGTSPLSTDVERFLNRIDFPYRFISSHTPLAASV